MTKSKVQMLTLKTLDNYYLKFEKNKIVGKISPVFDNLVNAKDVWKEEDIINLDIELSLLTDIFGFYINDSAFPFDKYIVDDLQKAFSYYGLDRLNESLEQYQIHQKNIKDNAEFIWTTHLYPKLPGDIEVCDEDHMYFSCDICEESIEKVWQKFGDCDICEKCIPNFHDSFELIDRTGFSIKDKPRKWPCACCNEKMGGGLKWYVFKNKVDLCEECFALKKYPGRFIDLDKGEYYVIERTDPILVLVESPKIEDISIPRQIAKQVTYERNETFVELLDSLVHFEPSSSVLHWTFFGDFHDMETYGASTSLAINIVDPSHPVASVVSDDHGRISIDIVFNTFDEYWQAYEQWSASKSNFHTLEENVKKVKKMLQEEYHCPNEIAKTASKSFSEYIRLEKDLEFYYG